MLTTESLSLINSNISYCKAQNGGGVFVQNTTLAYYLNNTVNYNTADNNGGGFFGERTPAIYARNDYYANQVGLAALWVLEPARRAAVRHSWCTVPANQV